MFTRFPFIPRIRDCSVVLVACGLVAAPGCMKAVQTCGGLHTGDRVEVTVVEPYDAQSHYTFSSAYSSDACNDGLDFAAGQIFDLTVAQIEGDTASCASAIADFGSQRIGGFAWALQAHEQAPPDALLAGEYTAMNGGCTGNATIDVYSDSTPFDPPLPGQLPHNVMVRSFASDASNSACPAVGTVYMGTRSCNGAFVVSVRKL